MAASLPEIGQIYRYTHDHQTYIVFVVGCEYDERGDCAIRFYYMDNPTHEFTALLDETNLYSWMKVSHV